MDTFLAELIHSIDFGFWYLFTHFPSIALIMVLGIPPSAVLKYFLFVSSYV